MPSNQASAGSSPTRCKYLAGYNLIPSREANGNQLCEKFLQENYSVEDTLHSNRRHSESSMAFEEEEDILYMVGMQYIQKII